jgi:hypothetical protein
MDNNLCECDFDLTYYYAGNDTCVTIYDPPLGYYNDGENTFIACGPDCGYCYSAAAGDCYECMDTYTMTSGECACQEYV